MPLKIAEIALIAPTLLAAALFSSALLLRKTLLLYRSLLLHRSLALLRRPLLRSLPSGGCWPTGWNISAANVTLATLAPAVTASPLSAISLRKPRNRKA